MPPSHGRVGETEQAIIQNQMKVGKYDHHFFVIPNNAITARPNNTSMCLTNFNFAYADMLN